MQQKHFASSLADEVLKTILRECEFSYARSSGSGGQNVNKVESKVLLRWNLINSTLAPELREQIRAGLSRYLTLTGELLITSSLHRDQIRNKQDVIEKLRTLLTQSFTPKKMRKATKPSRSQKKKRRENKKRISEKKQNRGKVQY